MHSLAQKKNLQIKFFANDSNWRNWKKFFPGENFQIYGIDPITIVAFKIHAVSNPCLSITYRLGM